MMVSEEYDGSSECLWADIFAVIIKNNNTGSSENLAVVPRTNTPISTATVHDITNQYGMSNKAYFERYNHSFA